MKSLKDIINGGVKFIAESDDVMKKYKQKITKEVEFIFSFNNAEIKHRRNGNERFSNLGDFEDYLNEIESFEGYIFNMSCTVGMAEKGSRDRMMAEINLELNCTNPNREVSNCTCEAISGDWSQYKADMDKMINDLLSNMLGLDFDWDIKWVK